MSKVHTSALLLSSVLTSLEYVKHTSNEVVNVGVLTLEDDDSVTILTKEGEKTFLKMDGVLENSTRQEFEDVVIPVKDVEVKVIGQSKMDKARIIFVNMSQDVTKRRIDIINQFVTELGISKEHAGTYHQTIKTRLKKEQESK